MSEKEKTVYEKLKSGKKICSQCKFYFKSGESYLCQNNKNLRLDLVTGNTVINEDCYGMRSEEGLCGPSGKLFEKLPS